MSRRRPPESAPRHPAHQRATPERAAGPERPAKVVAERKAPPVVLPVAPEPAVSVAPSAAPLDVAPAPALSTAALLLLVALGVEARALRRALPCDRSAAAGRVAVLQIGLGGALLRRPEVMRAIRTARPVAMVSIGFAGGLDPSLRVGDLVVGEPVVDPTLPGHWWPSGRLVREVAATARRARLSLRTGPVLSLAAVQTTPATKAVAASRHPALAVDMESACVARVAAEVGAPFLAVRVISDAAADRLPDEAWRLVAPDGGAPLSRALRYLVARPASLPTLVRTALRARRASAALTGFTEAWLASNG